MKKYLCLLLAAMLVLTLCACGPTAPSYTAEPTGDIRLVSCRFAEELRAADGEVKSLFYQQVEGKVYVSLRLSVANSTAQPWGSADITAKLHYQDTEFPLRYCRETAAGTGVDEEDIPAGAHSYVQMFTLIPSEAVDDDLSVSYTVNGKTYWTKVENTHKPTAMSGKMRVSQGEKVQIPYVDCEMTVQEVGVVDRLRATNQQSSFYPGPYALVKLQMTNNHKAVALSDIYGHTVKDGQQVSLLVETENEQGKDLVRFSERPLEPGQSALVYLFVKLDAGESLSDGIIRFNIAGSCYYVRMP